MFCVCLWQGDENGRWLFGFLQFRSLETPVNQFKHFKRITKTKVENVRKLQLDKTASAEFAVTLIMFVSRCRSSVALETQFYSWRHTPSSSRWRHVCVIVHDMPGNTPVRLMRDFRDYYNNYYRGVFPHVLRFRLFIFLHFIFFFLIPRHRFSFFFATESQERTESKKCFFFLF